MAARTVSKLVVANDKFRSIDSGIILYDNIFFNQTKISYIGTLPQMTQPNQPQSCKPNFEYILPESSFVRIWKLQQFLLKTVPFAINLIVSQILYIFLN